MIMEFILNNIGIPIAAGVGAGINWLFNKRKNNAEAKGVELSNDTIELTNEATIVDKWIKWSEKMEAELIEVKKELKQQKIDCAEETKVMQSQISSHEMRIFELERENTDLKNNRE